MATGKRQNPFSGYWEPVMKNPHSEPQPKVNSLQVMMDNMRVLSRQAKRPAAAGNDAGKPVGAPCGWCSRMETEGNLVQCDGCLEVFCTRTCSTRNYDRSDDRSFCLECNPTSRGSSDFGGSMAQPGHHLVS